MFAEGAVQFFRGDFAVYVFLKDGHGSLRWLQALQSHTGDGVLDLSRALLAQTGINRNRHAPILPARP